MRRANLVPRRQVDGARIGLRVDLSACCQRPAIGDMVTVIPNHACVTVNQPASYCCIEAARCWRCSLSRQEGG